jgi:eukaryotic-like serine/threonine-protein kinase
MPLTFQITEGPSKGASYTFAEHATFLVGRALDAHFRLPEDDRYFSRRHFIVEVNPPLCRLIDIRSRNGTLVNGKRVEMADLKDGDVVQGGRTTMRVLLESEPAVTLNRGFTGLEERPLIEGTFPQVGSIGAAFPPPGGEEMPAVRIPGYVIGTELGRGGMGAVYRATRESDGRTVAVKLILPEVKVSEHALARFLREIDTVSALSHENIVGGVDRGECDGFAWLAMEFVDGQDAHRAVERGGPLAVSRAAEWGRQLLDALAHAHDRGFVHRDVKPANLLVASGPEGDRLKLTDFGLARAYQVSRLSGLTLAGASGGTPKFMPPEQVLDMRSVKPAGDQYSAAATLYYLLTRKFLFESTGSVMDWFFQILEGTPTPIRSHCPEIPERLAAAIHRALSRKPGDRFRDTREFSRAIQEAGRG